MKFKNLVSAVLTESLVGISRGTDSLDWTSKALKLYHGTVLAKAKRYIREGIKVPTATIDAPVLEMATVYWERAVGLALESGVPQDAIPRTVPDDLLWDITDGYISAVRGHTTGRLGFEDKAIYMTTDYHTASEYARSVEGFGSELHLQIAASVASYVNRIVRALGEDVAGGVFTNDLCRFDGDSGEPTVIECWVPFQSIALPKYGGRQGFEVLTALEIDLFPEGFYEVLVIDDVPPSAIAGIV